MQRPQPKQEKAQQRGMESNDNLPDQTASGRPLFKGLPWAWLALSGVATFAWLIGIGWVALKLFWWLVD
jgi:hypothetical protein